MNQSYRDLICWQKGMDLVEAVYRETRSFPKEELYGLTSQMRRAAVSIPSNIAEGQGRGGDIEFVRFLRIAYGSLREVETLVMIAERLGLLQSLVAGAMIDSAGELGRVMNGLIKAKLKKLE